MTCFLIGIAFLVLLITTLHVTLNEAAKQMLMDQQCAREVAEQCSKRLQRSRAILEG